MVVDHTESLSDDAVDRLFHALADRTRRDIVARTFRREATVSQLAQSYEMSFAAVQKHVAVLERAGLVTKQSQGRERLVRANPEAIQQAQGLLDRYEHLWRERMGRLEAVLAESPVTDASAGHPATGVRLSTPYPTARPT